MSNWYKKLRSSMAANIILALILILAIFDIVVSISGTVSFTRSIRKENAVTTYHIADTATMMINGDHLDDYLAGEEMEEYEATKAQLDTYCKKMSITMIYVILVDQSDYGRFVSVFNPIDNSVDNSEYVEWELGHKRDTTNDEYRRKYKAIYDQESLYETVYRARPTDGQHPHITTLVPIKNSEDDVAAILCVQRPISELVEAVRPYLIQTSLTAFLLALIAGLLIFSLIRRQVLAPVLKVSDEAERFARENTIGEGLNGISRFEEISRLATSIDTMETDMVSYMDNLTSVTAERERIGAELSFARTIQEDALPNKFPAFPDRTDFDVYASMTPAKEVGGDFYNFYLIDEDHLAMVIGDVSGKGVPAALFMMVTNIVISDKTRMGGSPAEILNFTNQNICDHNKADMFVTLWLGILEISTGKLTIANAGHEDAAVCHKNGSFELMKTKHGIPVGVMRGYKYEDHEILLEKGDKLFLYTDGVPEAADQDNRMFTLDRMLKALDASKEKTPKEILEGIYKSVHTFVGDAPQFDDLTMLCVELRSEEK